MLHKVNINFVPHREIHTCEFYPCKTYAQNFPPFSQTSWRSLYRYLDIKSAIDYPRFMPSFHPTQVFYEYGLPLPVVAEMKRRGHKMTRLDTVADIAVETIGNVNSVCRVKHNEMLLANADARKNGESAGF